MSAYSSRTIRRGCPVSEDDMVHVGGPPSPVTFAAPPSRLFNPDRSVGGLVDRVPDTADLALALAQGGRDSRLAGKPFTSAKISKCCEYHDQVPPIGRKWT